MQQKIYVIRKLAYYYSDEYFYEGGPGGIEHVYYDESEALRQLQELESRAFRCLDLGNIEQLSPCGNEQHFRQQREALDHYFREILGKSLFTRDEHDSLYVDMHAYLPSQVSDEQIMQIRAISGIKFYELSVFENEAFFYAIWLPRRNAFYSTGETDYGDAIYFFNTHEEALAKAHDLLWHFRTLELPGSLADLSEQPAILQALIQQCDVPLYDEQKAVFTLNNHHLSGELFVMINALLKHPIFEIRTIALDEAAKIPHTPFEVM